MAPHVWPCVLALQGNRNGFLQMLQLIYFKFILIYFLDKNIPMTDTAVDTLIKQHFGGSVVNTRVRPIHRNAYFSAW